MEQRQRPREIPNRSLEPPDAASGITSLPDLSTVPSLKESGSFNWGGTGATRSSSWKTSAPATLSLPRKGLAQRLSTPAAACRLESTLYCSRPWGLLTVPCIFSFSFTLVKRYAFSLLSHTKHSRLVCSFFC